MKKLLSFLIASALMRVCAAEMIPVSVERSNDKEMECVEGRCDPEGSNLVCHLIQTTIRTSEASCKVSSRQYVLALQQRGPNTWGTWEHEGICKVAEAVTVELIPTLSALTWPGVLRYTVKSTVESRKDVPEFCSAIKDEQTWVYLKADSYQPQTRKCATIQFAL